MSNVTLDHFERAAADISAYGDNDTLPFDIDNRFISDNQNKLAEMAFRYCQELEKGTRKSAKNAIDSLAVFSERLLVPAGAAGFRTTTKIHLFWNLYFNGLGVAIAEALEPTRSERRTLTGLCLLRTRSLIATHRGVHFVRRPFVTAKHSQTPQ